MNCVELIHVGDSPFVMTSNRPARSKYNTLSCGDEEPTITSSLATALKLLPRFPSETRVYLPEDAAVTYAFRLPQSSYERISARARDDLNQQKGIVSFLRAHGNAASPEAVRKWKPHVESVLRKR